MEDDQNSEDIHIEGEKKIVVIGSKGCGKSSLITSFVSESPADMTIADPPDIRKTISFGRETVTVVLREAQPHFRHPLEHMKDFVGTYGALVCFAFNDAQSFRNVRKWTDDLKLFCRPSNLFVVGCKLDMKHKTAVSVKEWMDLERVTLTCNYLECSAKTGEGVSHLVRMVGNALMNGNPAVRG